MNQTKCFDYKGFQSKKDYLLNKAKNLIGKGLSKKEVLSRRLRLQAYYKDHPQDLKDRGKFESLMSLKRKLNYKPSSDKKVTEAYDKVSKSLKNTKYKPGSGRKIATSLATPLLVAPIPGTTAAAGAVIGLGVGADALQSKLLQKKNKRYKSSLTNLKKLESRIDKVDRSLDKKSKNK